MCIDKRYLTYMIIYTTRRHSTIVYEMRLIAQPDHHTTTPSSINTMANSRRTANHWIIMLIQKNGNAVHRTPSYGIKERRKCRVEEIAARIWRMLTPIEVRKKTTSPSQCCHDRFGNSLMRYRFDSPVNSLR